MIEILKKDYIELRKKHSTTEPEVFEMVKKVDQIVTALSQNYLRYTIDMLLDVEFNLSRLAEFIGTKASEADGEYTYFEDKYKQKYLTRYRETKHTLNLREEKVTVADIEAETTEVMAEFQDQVNVLYGHSKFLKGMVDSIERYLLCITHRLRELGQEKGLRQS